MNNRNVAHVWAQQNGKDARGSNFYSVGASIYSYGAHFEIARFVERNGARAVLFTLRGYSNSTSRHISYARGALHGLDVPVFRVAHLDAARVADNFAAYRTRVRDGAESAARARGTAVWKMERAQGIADEANAFAKFFGLRQRIKRPELTDDLRAKVAEHKAKEKAANAEREFKAWARECANAIKTGQLAAAWRKGAPGSLRGRYTQTMLRVRGDVIETSRGAEFPAEHGVKAFPIIAAMRQRGRTWERNGHSIHLGHFAIDSIDAQGNVRAGCHSVEWAEIENCARILGVQW